MVTDSAKNVLFYSNWPNIGHLENPDCIFIRNYGKFLGLISLCEHWTDEEKTTKNHWKHKKSASGKPLDFEDEGAI